MFPFEERVTGGRYKYEKYEFSNTIRSYKDIVTYANVTYQLITVSSDI